jgi:hypothetical protein
MMKYQIHHSLFLNGQAIKKPVNTGLLSADYKDLSTFPERRQRVQTFSLVTLPSTLARTL